MTCSAVVGASLLIGVLDPQDEGAAVVLAAQSQLKRAVRTPPMWR